MSPVIGLTTSIDADESVLQMNRSYIAPLLALGATPLLLPPAEDPEVLARYVSLCDGLLLSGGGDVDPLRFGEDQMWECGDVSPVRDAFELALFSRFLAEGGKPVLGICRGMQLMNVALGGSLYQDLPAARADKSIAHRQKQRSVYASHGVTLSAGSRLMQMLGKKDLRVNSHHHQAVNRVASPLRISALAPDGVIEAVEMPEHPFCIGVQWHPERLWDQPGSDVHARIFKAFVDAAEKK